MTLARFTAVGLALAFAVVAAEEPPVKLTIRDWKQTQAQIQKLRGQVVVVDVWTTPCQTCVDQFPKLSDWHRRYSAQGLAVIAVNCDYDGIKTKPPEFYRPDVEKFLVAQKAPFDNVLLSVPFADFLAQQKFKSTPVVLVYGRDGRLVKTFDNDPDQPLEAEFQPADVEKLLQTELAKPAPK